VSIGARSDLFHILQKSDICVISLIIFFLFIILQPFTFSIADGQTYNKIEYVYNIELMKGHLEQALVNKEIGNNSLSRAHISHSIMEIYDFIEIQLATTDSNLNALLFHALDSLSKNVEGLNFLQFKRETDNIDLMLNKARKLIVPKDNSTLNLIAATWLLDASAEKYEAGIANGKVKHLVDYQDSIGFISRSESLFNDTYPMLNQSMRIPADQAKSLFSLLNSKVQDKTNIDDLQSLITEIKQKATNITGVYLP
jgi:hypothetical protein